MPWVPKLRAQETLTTLSNNLPLVRQRRVGRMDQPDLASVRQRPLLHDDDIVVARKCPQ